MLSYSPFMFENTENKQLIDGSCRLVPLPAAIPSFDETGCIVDQTGVQCYGSWCTQCVLPR